MQYIKRLHHKLYHVSRIDETKYSPETYERLEKLKLYQKLRDELCSQRTALEAIKTSRSTYYRWKNNYEKFGLKGLENDDRCPLSIRKHTWTTQDEKLVLKIRKNNPLYGKSKIAAILARDYKKILSISMVGRILKKLITAKLVKPTAFYYGRVKTKRKRVFDGHSQRWQYGMKSQGPGELIQIDQMEVIVGAELYYHFNAVCPFTKVASEQLYKHATSSNAAYFLEHAKKAFPFPIKSIQVDGGSEFRDAFEAACQKSNIPLFVLPPKSPEYNGNVERRNSTTRYEFYALYEGPSMIDKIREALQGFVHLYNTFRPHQALQYLTPWQYCQKIGAF